MASADPLSTYNAKRDFTRTGEPKGKKARTRKDKLRFLVQKHDATRLHYDLRLEWGGVLKSWAVTRGPSVDPGDKRLAVMTEDHPMSYGDFEGVIPKKEYGGGTVMLWDQGTWEPLHDPEEGLKEGKLHFNLHGERMTGGWALVRIKPRKGEKRDNWLLIKERDAVAESFEGETGDIITTANMTSITSGRSMEEIAASADAVWSSSEKPALKTAKAEAAEAKRPKRSSSIAMPDFEPPMLATLVDAAPEGEDWLHEVKFDGYRLMAAIGGKGVALYTRTGLDWTEKFPDVAKALEGLNCKSALIDGEVMASDIRDGGSAFSALQKAIKSGDAKRFFAFDLLSLNGKDLKKDPLIDRKTALSKLISESAASPVVQYSEHVRGHGPSVFRSICKAGQEGIIAKKADAPYRGRRGREWLKVKCTKRQEFVIGGYSKSDKRGRAFASLLLGTREGDKLIYRGRVGTGFTGDTLDELGALLKARTRKSMPFESVDAQFRRDAVWVTPDLVAEVDYAELTDDGHIRHGSYLGLREDKAADDITLESATSDKETDMSSEDEPVTPKGSARAKSAASEEVLGIKISSPYRVVFPKQGVTKIDLARYFAVAAERMLPIVAGHPVSLVRCPQGRTKQCFFQKHASDGFPAEIKRVPIKENSGDTEDYMVLDSAEALVAAVQMGTLEFHIWGSNMTDLEKPVRMVFDLDPDERLTFDDVREAAFAMRDRLADLKLQSVPMVTGGKGVHVIVPLQRRATWPEVKGFSKSFAAAFAEEEPDRFVATMSKAKRKGRIFIDWLRNERGSTAIAPYSTRSREGAPVATPVSWDELADLEEASAFRLHDMPARLEAPDPWADAAAWRQSLTKTMLKAFSG
ncbi:DNA ligase D [Rhizobium sp. EC-SD404]|uniref:DNA ligase D n=1 Tax=Rhizobium sp. EC-SD404 TaxID=2038389 RepID=UPI0012591747|nr:DNA ligase D [Rhizobium sp. EC-SD404]VVT26113.1 ATP-dependent DNA ligase [Rhizobium sp. EC-SD404]